MLVGVLVGRGVQVGVGVEVAVWVKVGVLVGWGVLVGVSVGVWVEVGVLVGLGVLVGWGVLVGLGVLVGWGALAGLERGVLVGFSAVGVGLKTSGRAAAEAPSVMMTNAKVTSRRSWAQASLVAVYVVINTNQRPLVQPFASQSLSFESQ